MITLCDQEIMAYCFSILSNIFVEKENNYTSSICLLVQYFHRVLRPQEYDSVINPYTVIAAIDYLWKIVDKCKNGQSYFIKNGGIYLMLDLIEVIF